MLEKQNIEQGTRIPYQVLSLILSWVYLNYTFIYCAYTYPGNFSYLHFFTLPYPVISGITVIFAFLFCDELQDLGTRVDLRERLALFLFHVGIFFTPLILIEKFYLIFSIAALVLLFTLFLQREINFNRLVLACGILWIDQLIRNPVQSPFWSLIFISLTLLVFISSNYFIKYRRYQIKRGESREFYWQANGIWIFSILIGGYLIWYLTPGLKESSILKTSGTSGTLPNKISSSPQFNVQFFIEVIIWISVLFFLLYVIYWVNEKLKRAPQLPMMIVKAALQKVTNEIERKIIQPWRANLMNPTDKVIFYYNRFCVTMGVFQLEKTPVQTPIEYQYQLLTKSPSIKERQEDVEFITELFQRALYGGEVITSVESRHFQKITEQIIQDQASAGNLSSNNRFK